MLPPHRRGLVPCCACVERHVPDRVVAHANASASAPEGISTATTGAAECVHLPNCSRVEFANRRTKSGSQHRIHNQVGSKYLAASAESSPAASRTTSGRVSMLPAASS